MKGRLAFFLAAALSCLVIIVYFTNFAKERSVAGQTHVLKVAGMPRVESFDPLDADITSNLLTMRALYATPVEIGPEDSLVSSVLKSFDYDPHSKSMKWTTKDGATYHDGTALTARDVSLAVTRMLLKRPEFPVIKYIVGKEPWLASQYPLNSLPTGITVDQNTITIEFERDVFRPLFRFTLELFSIIPSRCIDLMTGEMTCERAPESGYYALEGDSGSTLYFERRLAKARVIEAFSIEYGHSGELDDQVNELKPGEALLTNDSKISPEQMKNLREEFSLIQLPRTRFFYLAIDGDQKPFNKAECRLRFANVYRSVGGEKLGRQIDASLFPSFLPGHVKPEEFREAERSQEPCDFARTKAPVKAQLHSPRASPNRADQILLETLKRLELGESGLIPSEQRMGSERDSFKSGKVSLISRSLGYWPGDPLGDIQMIFAPDMHISAQPVATNPRFRKLLQQLEDEPNNRDLYKKLNLELYLDASFNVLMQYGRVIIRRKSSDSSFVNSSMKFIYPWQMFE